MITEQQRESRQAGIGGSDAAAILGLSPYCTPLELWRQKTGQTEPPDLSDAEPVQWGNVLEDPVAREFSQRTGLRLHRVNKTLKHARHPFMLGHLDRRVVGRPELVEIKTVRGLSDDTPRPDHVAQVRHYMSVTGFVRAHVVYLIAGQRLVHYTVERDEDAERQLIQAERQFWQHVTEHTPPPPQSVDDLRWLHPSDNGQAALADAEALATWEQLHVIQTQRKALQDQEAELQRQLMERIGDASELQGPDGRTLVTWKAAKPSRTLDRKRLEAEHPELVQHYLVEKPGSRRFLLKGAGR